MRNLLFIFVALMFSNTGNSQSQNFQIGWYHLLPGSKTKLLVSYDRATNYSTNIRYSTDEVLLIFESKNNIGYAIDIDGRILQVDNMDKVKKIDTAGRVIKITKRVDVTLNKRFQKENNVWLVGFNSANNSARILLGTGEVVDIPKDAYVDIKEYFDALGQRNSFYSTEEH